MSVSPERGPGVDVTEGYVPCGDLVIDDYIRDDLVDYYATLENGDRAQYQAASIKERLAAACWGWGMSTDPKDHERSQALWSMIFTRAMAQVVLSGDPDVSKRKHIVPIDPYWRSVDEKFRVNLDDFTRRQGGLLVPHHLNFAEDSEYCYEPLAELGDFRVYGRFIIRGGNYIHAEYLAQHATAPLDT
jgi:hypothetical protein